MTCKFPKLTEYVNMLETIVAAKPSLQLPYHPLKETNHFVPGLYDLLKHIVHFEHIFVQASATVQCTHIQQCTRPTLLSFHLVFKHVHSKLTYTPYLHKIRCCFDLQGYFSRSILIFFASTYW